MSPPPPSPSQYLYTHLCLHEPMCASILYWFRSLHLLSFVDPTWERTRIRLLLISAVDKSPQAHQGAVVQEGKDAKGSFQSLGGPRRVHPAGLPADATPADEGKEKIAKSVPHHHFQTILPETHGKTVIMLDIFQTSATSRRWQTWFTETCQTIAVTGQTHSCLYRYKNSTNKHLALFPV